MATTAPEGRVPLSYWIVAGVSLLWNGFGATDYTMSRMGNRYWLAASGADPDAMLAYIDSFPMIADVAWALGVWGSFIGTLLLLARSRHAVLSFMVSLVGAVVSLGYQMTTAAPAGMDTAMNKAIPFVIIGIVAFLWWYSRRAQAQGILR